MKAKLIFRDRTSFSDGSFVEMKIFEVPGPVPPSEHRFKYSLFFGRSGERIVGYDNERGKGDHRHYGDREESYVFRTVEQLIFDFLADVEIRRSNKNG
jgi:hypothetical protein